MTVISEKQLKGMSDRKNLLYLKKKIMKQNLTHKSVFLQLPDAVVITDIMGRIVMINNAAAGILGFTEKEITGQNITLVLPDFPLQKKIDSLINDKIQLNESEYIASSKNKNTISLLISPALIEDADEKWIYWGLRKNKTSSVCPASQNHYNSSLLESISKISSLLINEESQGDELSEIFGIIGTATNSDRVFFFQTELSKDGTVLINQKTEWVSDPRFSTIQNAEFQQISYDNFASFFDFLKEQGVFQSIVSDLPDSEFTQILIEQKVLSILCIPVFINELFYGVIGFDDCKKERTWTEEEVAALRIIINNISKNIEVRQAQETLKTSIERYNLAISATQEGIWDWNIQTNEEYFSPRWCEINGYDNTDSEIAHNYNSWFEGIHPDYRDYVSNAVKNHLEKNEKYNVEYLHLHKDGKYRWQKSVGQAIFNEEGIPVRMVGSISDITQSKYSEEALKQREIFLESIFTHSPVPLLITELDTGIVILANQQFGQLLKTDVASLIGSTASIFDEKKDTRGAFIKELKEKGELKNIDLEFTDPEGIPVKCLLSSFLISLEGKAMIFTSIVDITERQKAETLIKEKEYQLRLVVQAVNAGWWDMNIVDNTVFVSDKWWEMRGYLPGEGSIEKTDIYHPDDMAKIHEIYSHALKNHLSNYDIEYRMLIKGGGCIPVLSRAYVLYEKGRAVRASGVTIDISNMKKAEKEIKDKQELMKTMIQTMNEGVMLMDTGGVVLIVNQAMQTILGSRICEGDSLEWAESIIMYQSGNESRILYDDTPPLRLLRREYCSEEEYRIIHPQKGEVYIVCSSLPVKDSEGVLIGGMLVCRDITIQTLALKKLRESNNLQQAIISAIPDLMFRLSSEGTFIGFNAPDKKFQYIHPEKFTGKKPGEVLPPHIADMMNEGLEKVLALQEQIQFEFMLDMDEELHFEGRLMPIHKREVLMIIRDVTQKKMADKKVLENEERFRAMVEYSKDVFIITKPEQLLYVSPNVERILGYTVEEFFAVNPESIIHPDDLPMRWGELKEPGSSLMIEYRFKNKKGEWLWLEALGINLFHLDNINAMVFNLRNITDRKNAEMQLCNQNQKLYLQNEELEQFAYITSHDLQEPLRTLTSVVELFKMEFETQLKGDGEKYLDFISNSSERMRQLVTGLLEYSRIGKEREIFEVDCNELIKGLLEDMAMSIREADAVMNVSPLPILKGYSVELKQLFQNLISNAIKFRKKNQIPQISISVNETRTEWLFAVEDNGIGIAEADREKIFIIFKRLHNRKEYEGTGIGLSHCKKIVELHGGKLWHDSNISGGSTFRFTIPKS